MIGLHGQRGTVEPLRFVGPAGATGQQCELMIGL